MTFDQLMPCFVRRIPRELMDGVLYVSVECGVAMHKCPCGCGSEVSTPLDAEAGWVLTCDGDGVTLSPSIGNYSYECQSHYFIRNNRFIWA
jgi:hypothetical protein